MYNDSNRKLTMCELVLTLRVGSELTSLIGFSNQTALADSISQKKKNEKDEKPHLF